MGVKLCKTKDIGETIRKIAWPSEDDAAQRIYEQAKNKGSINLKYDPMIYSYARKALTIGIIAATLYLNSCTENKLTQENNSAIKYSTNKIME